MILWLHGAFGAGKSSVAAELRARRPDLVPYDPEVIGYLLMRALPVPTGDFQDLPEWRELTVAAGAALDAGGQRQLLTPMTLLRAEYAEEIVTGLADRGVRVHSVLLDVAEDELRRRIAGDASPEHGDAVAEVRTWRQDHVADYLAARQWLVPMADRVVDTTSLSIAQATDEVLAALPG